MFRLFPHYGIRGGISDADEDTMHDEILIKMPKSVSVAVNISSL
jgi:hypothetical protein